jgi:hypothetical protein
LDPDPKLGGKWDPDPKKNSYGFTTLVIALLKKIIYSTGIDLLY